MSPRRTTRLCGLPDHVRVDGRVSLEACAGSGGMRDDSHEFDPTVGVVLPQPRVRAPRIQPDPLAARFNGTACRPVDESGAEFDAPSRRFGDHAVQVERIRRAVFRRPNLGIGVLIQGDSPDNRARRIACEPTGSGNDDGMALCNLPGTATDPTQRGRGQQQPSPTCRPQRPRMLRLPPNGHCAHLRSMGLGQAASGNAVSGVASGHETFVRGLHLVRHVLRDGVAVIRMEPGMEPVQGARRGRVGHLPHVPEDRGDAARRSWAHRTADRRHPRPRAPVDHAGRLHGAWSTKPGRCRRAPRRPSAMSKPGGFLGARSWTAGTGPC